MLILVLAEQTTAVIKPLKVRQIFSRKKCFLLICLFTTIVTVFSVTSRYACIEYNESKAYCVYSGGISSDCFYFFTRIYVVIKAMLGSWIPILLRKCQLPFFAEWILI